MSVGTRGVCRGQVLEPRVGVRVQEGLWLLESTGTRGLVPGIPGDFVLLPSRWVLLVCKSRTELLAEHPQLCRSSSAQAEEMHLIIFIRDLLFSSPRQSHFAFTARAARALSRPRCNSRESISVMEMAAKTTELSADVQLLQYIALCGCRRCSCCLAPATALKNRPPKKTPEGFSQ